MVTLAQDTPCQSDDDVARMPAMYFDHTKPKYPMNMGAYPSQERAVMTKRLTEIEKLEEKSRAGFQATGCVLRSSFNGRPAVLLGGIIAPVYGYQLAAYMNVCHVQQHVVKTVDEYRTVLRVDINPSITESTFYGQGSGDFYITDKRVRYEIYIDKSRISGFIAQDQVAGNKSDFDKINNGNGWTEGGMMGTDPRKYQWLDRKWYITRSGLPLLVPVTRKEYLEALLEYYEIEKRNFQQLAKNEADKAAYPKIYESKVANVKSILAGHDADWLGQQAVVDSRDLRKNDYLQASNGLFDFRQFSSNEETAHRLVQYNPAYFGHEKPAAARQFFMRVQFRYEMGRYFSETLFKNFDKNFDLGALRKMLE